LEDIEMKIVEGIQASGDHVWIVKESEVEGEEVEAGFRTEREARAYRRALLAYRLAYNPTLVAKAKQLRQAAVITYSPWRRKTMPQKMTAEILFPDSSAMNVGIAALSANGFTTAIVDWIDPGGTQSVWLEAFINTDLLEIDFQRLVISLVEPGGHVEVAGAVAA
jgi:hypothetical protein